ncbi:Fatty acid oxidation complex subunit alpha [subsurface metagenome]
MGPLAGGIIAQSGVKVFFLSRTKGRAEEGVTRAVRQARSEVIARNIVTGDYDTLLEHALKEADWIVESVSEHKETKRTLYEKVEPYRKVGSVVSSMTSSLPISVLCKGRSRDFKKHFLGIHFYNPPGKLIACEVAPHTGTLPEVTSYMTDFLTHQLRRVVVPVRDVAAYAGNRIGFLLFSIVAVLAEKHGVEMMDYLIGPYTGRTMPPLRTLDLVGLDIFKAIIENLLMYSDSAQIHAELTVPGYVEEMIKRGNLGNKTPQRGGFYKRNGNNKELVVNPTTLEYEPARNCTIDFIETAKELMHLGRYREAFKVITTAECPEGDIVRRILCAYLSCSYSSVGEVTERELGMRGIDDVMALGYGWAPPSVLLHMLGGVEVVKNLLRMSGTGILTTIDTCLREFDTSDAGRYFVAH